MPAALTFPGVYVEEKSSGVHTITGVATSIAAFLGKAVKGPVNEPVIITSFADFERRFGGIVANYPMGYAVRDFYANGGSAAVIVRLFPGAAPLPTAKWDVFGLAIAAASPGTWGNNLKIRIDQTNVPAADATKLWNLFVRDTATGVTESFLGVTHEDKPNRLDRVLKNGSSLISYQAGQALNFPTGFHTALTTPPPSGDVFADAGYSEPPDTTVPLNGGDGGALWTDPLEGGTTQPQGTEAAKTGLFALEKTDLFNILCLSGKDSDTDVPAAIYKAALVYAQKRRAMLLVDAPRDWKDASDIAQNKFSPFKGAIGSGPVTRNAALYFPRLIEPDPLLKNQPAAFPPAGAVAGVMARTDVTRGVWKAPAGTEAGLSADALEVTLTDLENGLLNPLGINCNRTFPFIGNVVWGARTLAGADILGDEYKYVPVRRLALFIEESLFRGLKWVVFEPNDEPLWSQIRLNVGAFMQGLFRQGAFQGASPRDAYFVRCDATTTTQNDINLGIVNIVVGFAPLKPAEFVVLTLQQIAGQIQT